jgi:hypothetical protein
VPVSFEFLRGVLGVLAVLFAHLAGRSGAQARKRKQKLTYFYGWVIRAAVCLIVVSIRHPLGLLDLAVWALSAIAFGIGWWDAWRDRPTEDLTKEIFRE